MQKPAEPGDRGDVHDRPPILSTHVPAERLAGDHRRVQVEVDDGDRYALGEAVAEVFFVPGHTRAPSHGLFGRLPRVMGSVVQPGECQDVVILSVCPRSGLLEAMYI